MLSSAEPSSDGDSQRAQLPRGPGRPRISTEQINAILSTFAECGDKTETARRLHISRSVVRRVLNGRHQEPSEANVLGPGERYVDNYRCGICGHKIEVLPCRICSAKAAESLERFRKLYRRQAAQQLSFSENRPSHRRKPRDQSEARRTRLAALQADTAQRLAERGLSKADMFGDPFADDSRSEQLELALFEDELDRLQEIQGLRGTSARNLD